jgi:hypothetical protein
MLIKLDEIKPSEADIDAVLPWNLQLQFGGSTYHTIAPTLADIAEIEAAKTLEHRRQIAARFLQSDVTGISDEDVAKALVVIVTYSMARSKNFKATARAVSRATVAAVMASTFGKSTQL